MKKFESQGKAVEVTVNSKEENSLSGFRPKLQVKKLVAHLTFRFCTIQSTVVQASRIIWYSKVQCSECSHIINCTFCMYYLMQSSYIQIIVCSSLCKSILLILKVPKREIFDRSDFPDFTSCHG